MSIAEFITQIKRRETPFYDRLYRIAKILRRFEVPYVPGFHDFLYHERDFRINSWRTFWRILYCQPLFRSRCVSCGRNLHIYHSGQGLPVIQGDLQIIVGDNVCLYDRITLAALTVGNKPKLVIGENTDISTRIAILVGNEVSIGSDCMIGCSLISDNPGHNFECEARHQRLKQERIGKIVVGNRVWAAAESIIIGKVTIGEGTIIGARAVVTKDVPPFCVVTGNPASIVKKLPFPEEMIARLGQEEYQKYLDAKVNSGR